MTTEEYLRERIKDLRKAISDVQPLINKERSGVYEDMPELDYLGRSIRLLDKALRDDSEDIGGYEEDPRISAIIGMQELPDSVVFSIMKVDGEYTTIVSISEIKETTISHCEKLEDSISGAVCNMLTKMMEEKE